MKSKILVKRLKPSARLPTKGTPGSSGFDLFACIDSGSEIIKIGPTPVQIPTGIQLEIPIGLDVQVRPRSGLTLAGVMVPLGTIDSDYRGEIFITMYCVGTNQSYDVKNGDRVAQLVITSLVESNIEITTEDLSNTERNAGGYGSTGT